MSRRHEKWRRPRRSHAADTTRQFSKVDHASSQSYQVVEAEIMFFPPTSDKHCPADRKRRILGKRRGRLGSECKKLYIGLSSLPTKNRQRIFGQWPGGLWFRPAGRAGAITCICAP